MEAASSCHPLRNDHSPSLAHTGAGGLKVSGSKLVLNVALLALCLAAAERAGATNTTLSDQALQAKIQYCTDCHQPSGQGYLGATPIPRLAGQQPEYFKNQLQAFIDRRRVNFFMFKVAHSLDPQMLTALADHFKDLNPKPVGGAPTELMDAGKRIFEGGVPTANVPPCASCHGPAAKGNGQFPRLAGQLSRYIIKVLTSWDTERGQGGPEHPDTSAIMKPIAHSLTRSQIEAVAAYLSDLE